jgi:hypothetical protein
MGDHGRRETDRPEKRQRLDEEQQHVSEQQQQQQQQAEDDDAAPPAPPPAHDQISGALTKLRNHLGNKNKFSKASQLLRQLLDAVDKVRGAQRCMFRTCIQAVTAMLDTVLDAASYAMCKSAAW